MMSLKEMLIALAQAYVDEVKRSDGIYQSLSKFDLYLEDEGSYLIRASEKILNDFNKFATESILDLVFQGETNFYTDDGKSITLSTVEEVIDFLWLED